MKGYRPGNIGILPASENTQHTIKAVFLTVNAHMNINKQFFTIHYSNKS